jgi:hypothetical protein
MRRSVKYLGLLSIFGAMTVFAQDAPPPAATPATALSVEQMKTKSAELVADDAASYRELLHLKEVAKKQKDLIKLNCINDKLVQLKAQITIAEDTNTELQAALGSGSDTRFTLFQRLSTDAAAVATLRDEGRACVGEVELYKQEAGVDVIRPDIIDDPTVDNPFDVPADVEPPGYASPFD